MGRARRDCCTAALLVCGPLPRLGFGLLASRNWSCGFPAPFSAAPNAAAVTTAALSATFAAAAFTASLTTTAVAATLAAAALALTAPTLALAPPAVFDERGSPLLDRVRTCRPLPILLWHSGRVLQAGPSHGRSRLRLRRDGM